MFAHLLLTAVQSRILLVLFLEGGLGTAALLDAVGLSGRAWNKEKEKLAGLGLLASKEMKNFSKTGIKSTVNHHLTKKGIIVANNIKEISESINSLASNNNR
jgi:hypothetical protein